MMVISDGMLWTITTGVDFDILNPWKRHIRSLLSLHEGYFGHWHHWPRGRFGVGWLAMRSRLYQLMTSSGFPCVYSGIALGLWWDVSACNEDMALSAWVFTLGFTLGFLYACFRVYRVSANGHITYAMSLSMVLNYFYNIALSFYVFMCSYQFSY